jgi:cobalt-precorrin 5A hydrolase
MAKENGLAIENPEAIKTVNMALVKKEQIDVHDPLNFLEKKLLSLKTAVFRKLTYNIDNIYQISDINNNSIVYIDDALVDLPSRVLVLRPPSLVAGIGCNRGTHSQEISDLLRQVLEANHLALPSLTCLASIDVKNDEAGLIDVARTLALPLVFYSREELNQVTGVKNPSTVVEKHVGVKSVCEAAAILAARNGRLIVPKNSTKNVTVAIARINFS